MGKASDSLSLTYKTAIVLIPPKSLWEPIQRIRAQHDRKMRRWMPHVTMIYPFVVREQFVQVLPAVEQICYRMQPFVVRLATIRTFHHGRGRFTMWLDPEPNEPICFLYEALWQACCGKQRQPNRPFRPHLSIGQVCGRSTMRKLVATLQESWKPLEWNVTNVSVIWRNDPPDDVFRIEKHISLGAER